MVVYLSHSSGTFFFFFFKQKTAYEMCGRDWSSDVCSSDLNHLNSSLNNVPLTTSKGKKSDFKDEVSTSDLIPRRHKVLSNA